MSKHSPEKITIPELDKVLTVSVDYSKLVARVAGYPALTDYYEDCSVIKAIKNLKKPLFYMSALDDPFFGPNVIPISECPENVLIGVTKTGGHVSHF